MNIYTHSVIIMAIVIVCLLVYIRDLHRRADNLYKIVKRLRLQERSQLSTLEAKDKEKLSADEKRFVDICKYMDDKKPFLNPRMNSSDLADAMGTNRTYISLCIRRHTDGQLSVQQFIMRYRLRYAAMIITEEPNTMLAEVAERSGFLSRSVFNRQFSQFYGCTPTEFKTEK